MLRERSVDCLCTSICSSQGDTQHAEHEYPAGAVQRRCESKYIASGEHEVHYNGHNRLRNAHKRVVYAHKTPYYAHIIYREWHGN